MHPRHVSTPARAATAAAAAAARRLPPGAPANSMLFGRIFPQLPPFAADTPVVQAALLEVGMQGGIMDAQDDLAAGPKALIVDPTVNGNPTAANPYGTNPDNPTMTAGSTFVGQFTDHDITFDQTSQLGVTTNPLTSPNTRTPALDLDSVFGAGPKISPDLYVANPDGSAEPALKIGTVAYVLHLNWILRHLPGPHEAHQHFGPLPPGALARLLAAGHAPALGAGWRDARRRGPRVLDGPMPSLAR
jgi:hypothetical protein